MTAHPARIIALAAVLIGMSALASSIRVHAQQRLAELPLDQPRKLAEQGDAWTQTTIINRILPQNG